MGLLAGIDLMLFAVLFVLFVYIIVSVTITNLHKVYLAFHFTMMVWPFCQFAIKTTDNPVYQLFYVKVAFADAALLAVGWITFTIFLTGQSHLLRRKSSIFLFIPALVASLSVIINPDGWFVLPVDGGYVQRTYGPVFWFYITIVSIHVIVSLYIIFAALTSDNAPHMKQQILHVLKGLLTVTAFILLDVFLNVVLDPFLPVIPGLTSLGILLSAIYFVISIHRDKVFDIVTIAHQDVMNTITQGILVLDDHEYVVEINRALLPYTKLHIGDPFDIVAIFPDRAAKIEEFLHSYRESPLERTEIEILHPAIQRILNIQAAPIMVSGARVGRIITFQDITELKRLIDETGHQNTILQERNHSLIEVQKKLFQTNRKLKQLAITDSLTGCYNRHYLTQQLEDEVVKNRKYQLPFAIILLDIDHFKAVNDHYGHLAGDEVICSTVEALKQTLRRNDVMARYGGEEFIVYLPNTGQAQAQFIAEQIKSNVEVNQVVIENAAHPVSITISLGLLTICDFPVENSKDSKTYLNDLFESVDKALYQAKHKGRNRIVHIGR